MNLDASKKERRIYSSRTVFWREASYFRKDCQIISAKKHTIEVENIKDRSVKTETKGNSPGNSSQIKSLLFAEKVFNEAVGYYENQVNSTTESVEETRDSGEKISSEALDRKKVSFAQEFVELTEKYFGKEGNSTSNQTQKTSPFETSKKSAHLPHTWIKLESSENSSLHRNSTRSRFKQRKNRKIASLFRKHLSSENTHYLESSNKNSKLNDSKLLPRLSSNMKYVIPPRFARHTENTQRSSEPNYNYSKASNSEPAMSMNTKKEITAARKPPIKSILDILEIDYPKNKVQNTDENVQIATAQSNSNRTDLLCIQVASGEHFCKNIQISQKELLCIKRDFPKLALLIPEPNRSTKVEYRAEIVLEFLRYMCGQSKNWTKLVPDWRTAIEMLALVKTYQLKLLRKSIVAYFNEGVISEENAEDIFKLSHHLQVTEIVTLCKEFLREYGYSFTELENDAVDLRKIRRNCVVTTFFHQVPLEVTFRLQKTEDSIASAFPKDVDNKIKFESVAGSYEISGIQLKFLPSDKDIELDIFCDLSNESEGVKWEEAHCEKKLDSVVVIEFRKKLLVKPKQAAIVNVTIESLRPRFTYSGKETLIEEKSSFGTFFVTLNSNWKVHADYKIFFIEKILYFTKE